MRDDHINIFYSEDDDGYIADIPDLEARIDLNRGNIIAKSKQYSQTGKASSLSY